MSDSARGAVRSGVGERGDELGFDNQLRVEASLLWPAVEFSLGYAPRLGLADDIEQAGEPLQVTFLHAVDAGVAVNEGRFTLSLRQGFGIGQESFGQVFATPENAAVNVPGTPAASGGGATPATDVPAGGSEGLPAGTGAPVPLESGIPVWSASTTGSLTYRWAARWRSNVDGGFSTTGGNGEEAELSYPRLQTADAAAGLTHGLTASQEFGGLLRGQRGWSERSDHWLLALTGISGTRFSAATRLELSGGAGFRDVGETGALPGQGAPTLPLGQPREKAIVPIGSAQLTHEVILLGSRARYLVSVGFEPSVDLLTARLQDRATALASASLATRENGVTLSVSGSQSFPTSDPNASRFIGLALALNHQFADWIGVELGGQLADQDTVGDSGTVWAVYLGLGATLPPIRF